MAIAAGEVMNKTIDIVTAAQGDGRHLQAGRPPFRAFGQRRCLFLDDYNAASKGRTIAAATASRPPSSACAGGKRSGKPNKYTDLRRLLDLSKRLAQLLRHVTQKARSMEIDQNGCIESGKLCAYLGCSHQELGRVGTTYMDENGKERFLIQHYDDRPNLSFVRSAYGCRMN